MIGTTETWKWLKSKVKPEWRTAFLAAVALGLLIHLPVCLADIPNHDGLDSMYFDQNMITSGRWFLTVACGFSSYYSLPWLISVLAVLYLGLTSVVLVEFLDLHNRGVIVMVSGLLVSFPALASTFAYVFTMDGYMMALFLAVLAVLLTQKSRWGFLGGAVCLAFSLGIYQAYLSFAILLSIYGILMIFTENRKISGKIKLACNYLLMGGLGAAMYVIVLQVLLKIQGKELASYQGISEGIGGGGAGGGLLETVKHMYVDFAAFSMKGNVVWNNMFSAAALLLLALLTAVVFVILLRKKKWWKNPWFFLIMVLLAAGLPVATNIILVISPDVTYHLLMRYQWVLYLILMAAFVDRFGCGGENPGSSGGVGPEAERKAWMSWGVLTAAAVLVFNYAVTDNIAYSNLQKRYEKTYAYCIRLLDRIEQTPGYRRDMPVAMVGVVGDDNFPLTDITRDVTSNMIGMNGDGLLYTGENYRLFMKYYLGATLNFLPAEAMADIYDSPEYVEMDGFPGKDSIRIVDGVMYIKTENADRGVD